MATIHYDILSQSYISYISVTFFILILAINLRALLIVISAYIYLFYQRGAFPAKYFLFKRDSTAQVLIMHRARVIQRGMRGFFKE